MFDLDRWQEIWETITKNKMRSALTAFGVFWGIFMLVVMYGSGNGLKNGVMNGIQSVATNSVFYWTNNTTEPYKGFRKGRSWSMRSNDIEIIKSKVPEVEVVSPMLFGGGRTPKNTIRGEKSGSYNIKGLNPDYVRIDKPEIVFGRYINEIDIQQRRKAVVIGYKVYEDLYAIGEKPIGTTIKVNGIYYTVIGVVKGNSHMNINGPVDQSVMLPYTTMQVAYNMGDRVHVLAITSKPNVNVSSLEDKIKGIIKKEHDISPTDPEAVSGFNLERQFKMFANLFLGIHALILIVGLGTLFAGIVGVSNIMMVTIRERTQEIGIRRALGATPMNILSQIMMESLVLTLIAGIAGLSFGVFILNMVDKALTSGNASSDDVFFMNPQISLDLAIFAMIILIGAGLLAGMVPARKALRIKAIDALRDE
jgi:putative ABC transport system permease protein